MKNILVTGSSGFIGSHLCERLRREGHRIVGFDIQQSTGNDLLRHDLSYFCQRANNLTEFDVVVHLAAYVSAPMSIDEPQLCYDTNVKGVLNALGVKSKKFIFASSAAVYGENQIPSVVFPPEDDHPEHLSQLPTPYAKSKLIGEGLVRDLHPNHGILRFFNVYGPNQNPAYGAAVNAFHNAYLEGQPYNVYGDGQQVRDFIHVDDVVSAIIHTMELPDSITANVGTGVGTSVVDLVSEFLKGEKTGQTKFHPKRQGDVKYSIANIEKLKSTGWCPMIGIQEGIERLKTHG